MFTKMSEVLQEKTIGDYKIKHLSVTEKEAKYQRQMSAFRISSEYRDFKGGIYTQLFSPNGLEMSDTPMEQNTNREFIQKAKGNVLIAGLGIGMILLPLEAKPEVDSITVVEQSQGIIDLVWPQLTLQKSRVIQADIFTYETNQKFDTIYFDIWPTISGDNYPEMEKLHTRFADNLTSDGWLNSWRYDYCLAASEEWGCEECYGEAFCQYCAGDGHCQHCEGDGKDEEGEMCYECDTTGNCLECEGTGECSNCQGHGHTKETEWE